MDHGLICDAGRSDGASRSQVAWWIDDAGRALPHSTIASDRNARRFAFTYLGMTEVVCSPAGMCIRWNVARVAFGSLTAVIESLIQHGDESRVVLEYFWGAWASESGYTPSTAANRMIATMAYANVEPFCGTTVLPRDATAVREDGGLVRAAFEGWDSRHGLMPGRLTGDRSDSLKPYLLGLQHDRRESDLLISHVGDDSSAARVFGADWATEAIGRVATRSQPDYEYDERVCDVYDGVMNSGEIRVDHVQAFIRRPNNDPVWVPYSRLVLRTRDTFGTPTLLSVVEMRTDIDIPFMVA